MKAKSMSQQIDAFLQEVSQSYKSKPPPYQNYSYKSEIGDTPGNESNSKKQHFEIDEKDQNCKNDIKRKYQEFANNFPAKKKREYDGSHFQMDELEEGEIRESDEKYAKSKSFTHTESKPIPDQNRKNYKRHEKTYEYLKEGKKRINLKNYSHKSEIKRHSDAPADESNNKKRRFEIDDKNQNHKNDNKRKYQELANDFPANKKYKYDGSSFLKDKLKEKIGGSDGKYAKSKSLICTKSKPISDQDRENCERCEKTYESLKKAKKRIEIQFYNKFLNSLGKCKKFNQAEKLYKEIGNNANIVTKTTMIKVFADANQLNDAIALWEEVKESHEANIITKNTMIKVFADAKQVNDAIALGPSHK
jgi:pentatricopeptide repeat protein